MPICRHEIVLKFQYSNSTQILQCHQLLILPLLWRDLHHLLSYSIHSHTRIYTVFVVTGSLLLFHNAQGQWWICICFLGNIGPKAVRGVQICIADANATRLWFILRVAILINLSVITSTARLGTWSTSVTFSVLLNFTLRPTSVTLSYSVVRLNNTLIMGSLQLSKSDIVCFLSAHCFYNFNTIINFNKDNIQIKSR